MFLEKQPKFILALSTSISSEVTISLGLYQLCQLKHFPQVRCSQRQSLSTAGLQSRAKASCGSFSCRSITNGELSQSFISHFLYWSASHCFRWLMSTSRWITCLLLFLYACQFVTMIVYFTDGSSQLNAEVLNWTLLSSWCSLIINCAYRNYRLPISWVPWLWWPYQDCFTSTLWTRSIREETVVAPVWLLKSLCMLPYVIYRFRLLDVNM
jgi:hypothetical protein